MRNALRILFLGMTLLLTGCASQVWIPDWKESSHLNVPRAGTTAVQVKDRIYLIGGVDGNNFLKSTEYAEIREDGSLGPWQMGPELHEERGFIDAAVHGDYVYVVGGGNGEHGQHLLHSVERAKIQADGSLGPWEQEKNGMVVARRCSKVIATDRALYSFGGFGGVLLDSVEYAEFQPDGSLGEWQLDPNMMTVQRYINSVKKEGDVFFVIGGHDQSKGIGITNVEWSRPNKDGSLQPWAATTPMKQGRYALSTASYGDYIYALGGISGAEYLDSIEFAKVGKDGKLSPWQPTSNLDQTRAYFSTIDYKGKLYVIAGTNREGYMSSVIYAGHNSSGDIGYWGTKEEAAASKARIAKRLEEASHLPNEGVVQEVLQTQAYTYAYVDSPKDGQVWLAGPKLNGLQKGDRLGYSEGVGMPDFFSKELKRSFQMVIFVGQMQVQNPHH
jgi:hypothetical protein